jgi:hypothetical protein
LDIAASFPNRGQPTVMSTKISKATIVKSPLLFFGKFLFREFTRASPFNLIAYYFMIDYAQSLPRHSCVAPDSLKTLQGRMPPCRLRRGDKRLNELSDRLIGLCRSPATSADNLPSVVKGRIASCLRRQRTVGGRWCPLDSVRFTGLQDEELHGGGIALLLPFVPWPMGCHARPPQALHRRAARRAGWRPAFRSVELAAPCRMVSEVT